MLVNAFHGTVVAPGAGLGGRALQLGRPVVVNEYLRAAVISHQFDSQVVLEQIHSGFAVPVKVGGHTQALVYGINRTPQPFGDRVLQTAGPVVARLTHDLAVEMEVARRIERIRQDRSLVDAREVCEELRSIAVTTSDEVVRERLMGSVIDSPPSTGQTGRSRSRLANGMSSTGSQPAGPTTRSRRSSLSCPAP